MRLIIIAPALAVPILLGIGACSPGDQHKTTNDIKATASDLTGTVRQGTNSPAGAELKSDVKDLAHDTGKALKQGAKETKQALDSQVEKQKR